MNPSVKNTIHGNRTWNWIGSWPRSALMSCRPCPTVASADERTTVLKAVKISVVTLHGCTWLLSAWSSQRIAPIFTLKKSDGEGEAFPPNFSIHLREHMKSQPTNYQYCNYGNLRDGSYLLRHVSYLLRSDIFKGLLRSVSLAKFQVLPGYLHEAYRINFSWDGMPKRFSLEVTYWGYFFALRCLSVAGVFNPRSSCGTSMYFVLPEGIVDALATLRRFLILNCRYFY